MAFAAAISETIIPFAKYFADLQRRGNMLCACDCPLNLNIGVASSNSFSLEICEITCDIKEKINSVSKNNTTISLHE